MTLKKRGMPYYQDSMSQGDLNIQFEIEFPKSRSLTASVAEKLKEILPAPKNKVAVDPKKCEILEEFDESTQNLNPEGGK